MSYTNQVSDQMRKIQNQKFIMALAKQYSSSDIQTIKKLIASNIKLIQNFQTNIGISYQQILGNFGNQQIIQPEF